MSESQSKQQQPMLGESKNESLKYLEFVHLASIHAVLYAAELYSYAKENSGPLKPRVNSIEGNVKNVVGPVYEKYHHVPTHVLKFVDTKVDESFNKIQTNVPPTLTQALEKAQQAPVAARAIISEVKNTGIVGLGTASGLAKTVIAKYEPTAKELYTKYEPKAEQYAATLTQALEKAQQAPVAARAVISEVKIIGMVGTASGFAKTVIAKYEPTAKELYTKYEPKAEQYAATTWSSLNQLPLFPRVAQAVTPIASYGSKKYNQTVQSAAEKGYKVAPYLPLVPTERIAKVLSGKIEPVGGAVAAQ